MVVVAALASLSSGCKESDGIAVISMAFDGNHAITDAELAAALSTKATGRLPWSDRRLFNQADFTADLKRLETFYLDRGYPDARVVKADMQFNAKHDGVRVVIGVSEGTPVLVERVSWSGFDVLTAADQKTLDALPLKAGQPLDRRLAAQTRDEAQSLLRNHGYPYATATVSENPGADARHVVVSVDAVPGTLAHFGEVSVVGNTSVDAKIIRRTLTFATGDLYREREVLRSQRRLASLQLFDLANIDTRHSASERPTDVPVTITVAEGKPQRATFRVGFGSEEKARVSAEWSHLNFFGGAKTATVEGKWSALERGGRLTFGQPAFFWQTAITVSGAAWWAHEPAYTSQSTGGRVTISRPIGGRSDRRNVAQTVSITYVNEFLWYEIAPAAASIANSREQLIAIGLDPDTGKGSGTLASIELNWQRRAVNTVVDPTKGYLLSLHLGHATPSLGGTFRFDELLGEARTYVPIGRQLDWAMRIRSGAIVASDPATVPFSERYFLGGSTSLRGWGRYQVGPLDASGQVVGGRRLIEISNELRVGVTDRMALVAFLDAGNVWDNKATSGLRYDVGPGLRYKTPIGPVRVDVGFQLNPIPGLMVNGQPMTRRWRLSFSVGQAF